MSEITAKISKMWIKKLATWNATKPTIQMMNRRIAIPRNGPNLMCGTPPNVG
jgi:hypothetical protein